MVLKGVSANNDLIIQKSDKGNSVVFLNMNDHIKPLNEMLSDSSKFKKINVKHGKEIKFLLQQEDRLTNFLKKVKRSISEQLYKELYPRGSQPGIMYGLSKIYKPLINNFPKLHPILSAINTATKSFYGHNQNSNCFMASLDVGSLFTNIPLDETKICIDEVFKSDKKELLQRK